jgi:hypothetical protein
VKSADPPSLVSPVRPLLRSAPPGSEHLPRFPHGRSFAWGDRETSRLSRLAVETAIHGRTSCRRVGRPTRHPMRPSSDGTRVWPTNIERSINPQSNPSCARSTVREPSDAAATDRPQPPAVSARLLPGPGGQLPRILTPVGRRAAPARRLIRHEGRPRGSPARWLSRGSDAMSTGNPPRTRARAQPPFKHLRRQPRAGHRACSAI